MPAVPAPVQNHFGRYVHVFHGDAVATGLFMHGTWQRIPLHLQRPVTADWAAGAMAAGATAVVVNYFGDQADFQLDELV